MLIQDLNQDGHVDNWHSDLQADSATAKNGIA